MMYQNQCDTQLESLYNSQQPPTPIHNVAITNMIKLDSRVSKKDKLYLCWDKHKEGNIWRRF